MTDGAFKALLKEARKNNKRFHITGILMHVTGLFVQFLKGPEQGIDQFYTKIARDEGGTKISCSLLKIIHSTAILHRGAWHLRHYRKIR